VETETTAEIAVTTVDSLDGMSVEEYATRLFDEWGVGKEAVDNGVLVVVARTQREMRIEVGYGLEPVLPDGLAGEIIRTNFLPHFREDRYEDGIVEGMTRIAAVVRRNHVLTPEERAALDASTVDEPLWLLVPFFGLFVGIGAFMAGVGLGSKTIGPMIFGLVFGGMPMGLSLLTSTPAAILGTLAVGAVVYGYRTGRKRPAWVRDMRRSASGSGSSSGWVMGGGSSSGGSGSGSSGGGSFGGGSSGGGGASGRW
jgi:uncharacterized protein